MEIDPEQFAIAVVTSSDSQLSIEEKYRLYQEAYDYVQTQSYREDTAEEK
ncbi:hypothetical protein QUW13_07460 [Enterococcus hirae]|jgi:hypothetical protein|nr:hypothetical protein [Enterococcaceae bacterium]MCI1919723.1 hypothetical protein [Enterococcaceae bacterium]MDM8213709.1 hypothetical protein [Enterococcus hirae]